MFDLVFPAPGIRLSYMLTEFVNELSQATISIFSLFFFYTFWTTYNPHPINTWQFRLSSSLLSLASYLSKQSETLEDLKFHSSQKDKSNKLTAKRGGKKSLEKRAVLVVKENHPVFSNESSLFHTVSSHLSCNIFTLQFCL